MTPQREEQLRDTLMKLRGKATFLRRFSLAPRDEMDAEVFPMRLLRTERILHRIELRLANAQLQMFNSFRKEPTESQEPGEPVATAPVEYGRLGDLVRGWLGVG